MAIKSFVTTSIAVSTLIACGTVAAVPADRIFASAFTPALIIEGKVGYPAALANALVEFHVGAIVTTSRSLADGRFYAGLELDQIAPDAIVELIARGSGAQARVVWASAFGPAQRLLDIGGATNRVTFADEPFVHLNPRTTVVAAALRAYNGGAPIADPATFDRAARSRQTTTDSLVLALAMVARGSISLPAEATDTFAAVTDIATARQLYAAEQTAAAVDGACTVVPLSPWCVVWTTLPTDPDIVPARAWNDGTLYSFVEPFLPSSFATRAYRPAGTHVDVIGPTAQPIHADVVADANGGYRLTRPGGASFLAYENYPEDPDTGMQYHEHAELLTIHVRPTAGPGGQFEFAEADDYRFTYPENPEHPTRDQPGVMSLPGLSTSDPLPPSLVPGVPSIANHGVVLPAPFANTNADFSGAAYDEFDFSAAGGVAARLGRNFTFAQAPSAADFALDFGDTQADVHFVNEEETGVWRVQVHATSATGEMIVQGLLIPIDPLDGWTAAAMPGSYQSRLNGHYCSGPYDGIDDLTAFPICLPAFVFTFAADGSVQQFLDPPSPWGNWMLGSGANAGRVFFDRTSLLNRRGWQRIRTIGTHEWVLENSDYSDNGQPIPPVAFGPTPRLIRYDRL